MRERAEHEQEIHPDFRGSSRSLHCTVIIELGGGGLGLLGLLTTVATLLCSGAVAFAYFTVHQPQALLPLQNGGEPAALFSWIFPLIAVLSPGPFALDAMLGRVRREQQLAE